MNDLTVAIGLLVSCLVLGALVNISLLFSMGWQWLQAIRARTNGPHAVIVRGTVRRILLRLILQTALIVQFSSRLWSDQPAGNGRTFWVALIVVLALSADAVGDVFDFRLLRWQLREK